jgi:hypothetical protein
VIGNGFVLLRCKELKALGHECGEFVTIVAKVGQDLLNRTAELRKGGVVAIARHLALQELPEALDQVQVRRVGRQIEQFDVECSGCLDHRRRTIVRRVIEHDEQRHIWGGRSDLAKQQCDPLGITRLATFPANQVVRVGRIGPKDVEAIAAGVGLELHRLLAPDPALRRDCRVQEMGGVEKIDLALLTQAPFFAV